MTEARDLTLDDIRVGMQTRFEHMVTSEEVDAFAALSGDYNPLHVDDAYANTTPFKKRVVHGMLLGALVSRLVGMHLPGTRALLIKESLIFKLPVYIGDPLSVEGLVTSVSAATRLVAINVTISRKESVVAAGEVLAQVRI